MLKAAAACVLLAATSALHDLTLPDFQSLISSEPLVLILFYAPWCSVSQEFLPVFEEAASSEIVIGKVDCIEQEYLYTKYGINSFPTVVAFVYGNTLDYDETFDHGGLSRFMGRLVSSGTKNIDDSLQMSSFLKENLLASRPVVIALGDDPHMMIAFDYACMKTNVASCANSEDKQVAAKYSQPFPSIFLYRSFDAEEDIILAPESTHRNTKELIQWIYNYSSPQIIKFSKENEDMIFDANRPGFSTHIVVIGSAEEDSTLDAKFAAMRLLYATYWDSCRFIYIDSADKSAYISDVLNDLQLSRSSPTTIMAVKTLQTKVEFYNFTHIAQIDALDSWINAVVGGSADVFRLVNTA